MGKNKLNSNGITVIETLIALGIFTITAIGVLPIFISQMKTINMSSESGLCRFYLTNIFAKIDKLKIDPNDSRGIITPTNNFSQDTTTPQPGFLFKDNAALRQRFEFYSGRTWSTSGIYEQRGATPFNFGFPSGDPRNNIRNNGVLLYTPLLLDNSVAYLNDLYNISGYKEAFRTLPGFLSVANTSPKFTPRFEIKIETYLLATGAVNAIPGRFWLRPKNIYETQKTLEPYTYRPGEETFVVSEFPSWMKDTHGFRVTVSGTLTESGTGRIENCEQKKDYAHQIDLQNSLDFTTDVKGVRASGGSRTETTAKAIARGEDAPPVLRDEPPFLSNKNSFADTLPYTLKTIFTNTAWTAGGTQDWSGRQRPICSQNQSTRHLDGFYVTLRTYDILNKEPGAIPLCMDASAQWLSDEGAGWCTNNHYGTSRVYVNYDWRPRQTGWVPCEKLILCGETPDRVELVTGIEGTREYYEYRYYFNGIVADDNSPASPGRHKRFWGCELKFAAAVVDVSGNMIYPPRESKISDAFFLDITSGYDSKVPKIREMNPKIYFKPPPCYTCDCNRCRRGKGGFLGGWFRWVLAAVLIGAALGGFGADPFTSAALGTLGGLCATGGLGCGKDPTVAVASNITGRSGFTSCDGGGGGCRCGSTCQRRDPPGPRWADVLSTDYTVAEDYEAALAARACAPTTRTVTVDGVTFNVRLAYRSSSGGYNMTENVAHFDEIYWQQLVNVGPQTYYCTARFQCNSNVWQIPLIDGSLRNADTYRIGSAPTNEFFGCFPLRTAYAVNWRTTDFNRGIWKPELGSRICVDINFNRQPFGGGGNLMSRAEYNTECSRDAGAVRPTLPALATDPAQRILGNRTGACATPQTFTLEGDNTDVTATLVAPFEIATPAVDADGNPLFDYTTYPPTPIINYCWEGCTPSNNLPQSPLSNPPQQMMYYEAYDQSADASLPFCGGSEALRRSDLDY